MDTDKKKTDPTQLTHKQSINRLKDIKDELERLAGKEAPTVEDDRAFADLVAEAELLNDHVRNLEREADLEKVRAIVDNPSEGRGRVETGDGAKPADPVRDRVLNPDSVADRRFRDPWDLSEMRAGLTPVEQASEVRSRALSAIERMPASDDERREIMTRFVERYDTRDARISWLALTTSSEAYVRAFGKLLGHQGDRAILDSEETRALQRAMSLTEADGGYLVPFQLDPAVINTAAGSVNEVRQISRQVIATGNKWHGVTSAGVSGSWDGEATPVSDDSPTLAQPEIDVHKLAIFVPISIEALQDAMNVAQEVSEMIAFKKDEMESIALVTGSGSGQPKGIVTALEAASGSLVDSDTVDALSLEDVYALDQALPARYRRRSSWLAHRATYNAIRQFDTTGGAALWERLGADVPGLLVGRPAYESEAMESDPAATDDTDPGTDRSDSLLVFGDFSNYVIADRLGTTVEFIPHLFRQAVAAQGVGMPTGQRGWYAYARVGADAVNPAAFRLLQA